MLLPLEVEHAVHHVLQHLGSRDGSLLVHVADDEDRDVPALGQLHEGHGTVLHLPHTARRALQRAVVESLDGVHNQNVRRFVGYGLEHILQPGLRQNQQTLASHAQALGPQLQLAHRLLAGHVQHPVFPAEAAADLEHQGGLPHPRRAAYQHQRALHRSPAQHAVQLPHTSGKADFFFCINICQGYSLYSVKDACAAAGTTAAHFRRRLLLHHRVPRAACRALPCPLGGLVAALGTVKDAALLCHGCILPVTHVFLAIPLAGKWLECQWGAANSIQQMFPLG